jgi:hypothetical protein
MSGRPSFFVCDQPTPLMRVCGWCNLVLSPGREPISHGICEDCNAAQLRDLDELKSARAAGA